MKLATRMWLFGALLPVLVMAAVLFSAERVFVLALARSLDQALLAQAAVESVSLFDGPRGQPHLHMVFSPLVESVRGFAPEGVLFGPDGREVMRYPPGPSAHDNAVRRPGTPGAPPVLTTEESAGTRRRTLEVTVSSPDGQSYMLQLTANLAQVDASQRTLQRLALAALLVITLVLVIVQSWEGRTLRRRLSELGAHVDALRAGDLEHRLAPEKQRDELAELRTLLAHATTALKRASDSKERLLADAAHELRTPLTLMRTSLDLALRRERSSAELKSALADTRDEVDRLALLATRLLDSAALGQRSGPPECCDLTQLLRDALDAARPEAQARGLGLSLDAPERLSAWLRPQAVRQALDNLVSNALKYARQEIAVELRSGVQIVVTVRDDGPGIPKAEHERVFEPFHRVQQGAGGVGLGLAIVREVAHAHRGRAYVAEAATGTAMVLELDSLEPA